MPAAGGPGRHIPGKCPRQALGRISFSKKVAKAEEGEKKPASRRKAAAKAGEAPAEEAEKKPARRAAKPKAEDGEAEKKPARRTRAKKAEPEA